MTLSTPSSIDILDKNSFGRLPIEYVVVDELLNRYIFAEMETTKMDYSYNQGTGVYNDSIKYTSAWHLSKIISITGDTINFEYEETPTYTNTSIGLSDVATYTQETANIIRYHSGSPSNAYYKPKRLKRITSRTEIVEFDYIDGLKTLSSIIVRPNNSNTEEVKRFVLNHSSMSFANRTKMILTSIEQVDVNSDNRIILYGFDYDEGSNNDATVNLFRAQDHWGYYNGQQNDYIIYAAGVDAIKSGNRNPNFEYAKRGVLRKINYPTGGYTELNWELNDYSYQGNIKVDGETPVETVSNSYIIRARFGYFTDLSQIPSVISKKLTLQKGTVISADFTRYAEPLRGYLDLTEYDKYHDDTETTPIDFPRFEILDQSGRRLEYWYIDKLQSSDAKNPHKYTIQTTGDYTLNLCNPLSFGGDNNAQSLNGVYGGGPDTNNSIGYIAIKTERKITGPTSYKRNWGGLRIESIVSEGAGVEPITKKYHYLDGSLTSRYSSGVIWELPSYNSLRYDSSFDLISNNNTWQEKKDTYVSYGTNGLYSTPLGGSHVEYFDVWEEFPSDSLIIRYQYISQRNYPDESNSPMYDLIPGGSRMNTSYSHYRGDLSVKEFYQHEELYKQEEYTVQVTEQSNTPTFLGVPTMILSLKNIKLPESIGGSITGFDYAASRYKLIPYNKREINVRTTEFANDIEFYDDIFYGYYGNGAYTYSSSPSETFKLYEKKENSLDENEMVFYTYKNATIPISGGTWSDAVKMVETIVTTSGDIIVSAKRMEYDANNRLIATYISETGIPIKSEYKLGNTLTASNALKEIINNPEYTYRYNDKGNLIEVSYNGIVLSSFLWAYQGSHPIAEIKNVTYEDLCENLPSHITPDKLYNRHDITETDLALIKNAFQHTDVITIRYHWLTGVASMTDSRGVTSRFSYDGYGRLNSVSDYNNYLIKKHRYHLLTEY